LRLHQNIVTFSKEKYFNMVYIKNLRVRGMTDKMRHAAE
jgi:hypothetical protein